MKRATRTVHIVMVVVVILFAFGCAKKALEPVATEVPKAAQPQAQPVPAPDQGDMKMDTPAGAEEGAMAGKAARDKARAVFENTDIFFEYDSFDLTAEAKRILAEKAGYLSSHPTVKVRIEGNCDERGTQEYNLALGERRAKAAQDYLVFLGIASERLSTVSYGEERPLDPGQTEEAWAKNRRTHFAVTGE